MYDSLNITGPHFGAESVSEGCRAILLHLGPGWLKYMDGIGPPGNLVGGITNLESATFCAVEMGAVVGFLTLHHHNACSAEIRVMGVLTSHRQQGIGSSLIRTAEEWLRTKDVRLMSVKTAPTEKMQPAVALYTSMGFTLLEEINTGPGTYASALAPFINGCGSRMLLYVKALGAPMPDCLPRAG